MQVTFNEGRKLCHKWMKNKETSVPWVWILRKYLKITRDRGALICPISWRFTQEKGGGISSRKTLAQGVLSLVPTVTVPFLLPWASPDTSSRCCRFPFLGEESWFPWFFLSSLVLVPVKDNPYEKTVTSTQTVSKECQPDCGFSPPSFHPCLWILVRMVHILMGVKKKGS